VTVPRLWESLRCEIKNLWAEGNKVNFKLLMSTRGEESCPLLTCPLSCNSECLRLIWSLRPPYGDFSDQATEGCCMCLWVGRDPQPPDKFPLHLCCIFLSLRCFVYESIPASKAESSSAFTTTYYLLKHVQQHAHLRSCVVYQFKMC